MTRNLSNHESNHSSTTDELVAQMMLKLVRSFCGTEDMAKSKGHQPGISISVEEMREFRKTTPATHMWAEWERKILSEAS